MSVSTEFLGGGLDEVISLVNNTTSLKDGLKGVVPEVLLGPIEGISKRLTEKLRRVLPTNITMDDLPSLALNSASLVDAVDSVKEDCEQLSGVMEQLRNGDVDFDAAINILNTIGTLTGPDEGGGNG